MECVELAPAVRCVARFDSGSNLHALHTLRAVWFRLRRAEDKRALPAAVTEGLPVETRSVARGLRDFAFEENHGAVGHVLLAQRFLPSGMSAVREGAANDFVI